MLRNPDTRQPRTEGMEAMEVRKTLSLALALAAYVYIAGAVAVADGPAYRIVLGSRHAEVSPANCSRSQTGGGSIVVNQPEPNTLVVAMGGAAVAGSTFHVSNARMHFQLAQDLRIEASRPGVRPPRIGMIARVVGTLQVVHPQKCGRTSYSCGQAHQGPAAASLAVDGNPLLSLDVEPSAVACGQKLSINHQAGPVETMVAANSGDGDFYQLTASFDLHASQGKGVFNRQYAMADFDPAPQLDAFWADALKPFRAVPREQFGFTLVVRVVEDSPAELPPAQVD